MKKLAKITAKRMFEKVAEEEGRAYPLSRIYTGLTDLSTYGFSHAVQGRAAQGRANLGQKGVSKAENLKLKAVKDEGDSRTYPVSRFLTNPLTSGVGAGVIGLMSAGAKNAGPSRAGLMAAGAGTAGYLTTQMIRDIYSRSDIGKANSGRKGFGSTKQKQLRKLREAKVDTNPDTQSQMDSDTLKRIALAAGSEAGKGLI